MKYVKEGIIINATVNKKITGAITGHFLIDLYTPILPIILPLLIDTMGLSYFLAGLIVTAFNVVSSVTQPFVGLYSDKKPEVKYELKFKVKAEAKAHQERQNRFAE